MYLKQNSFGKKPCVRRGRIDYYQPHFGDVPELRKVVTKRGRNESFLKQIENEAWKISSGTTNRTLGTSPNYCKERAICPLLRQWFFSRLEFKPCVWLVACLAQKKSFSNETTMTTSDNVKQNECLEYTWKNTRQFTTMTTFNYIRLNL